MYQKYHTEALVLGSRETGESDRTVTLFTRDFGLVRARASAIRSEKSKMRYALQNYTYANVSLVRGKNGWRAAGATALLTAQGTPQAIAAFARIAELAMRFVGVDENNEYIFLTLMEAHEALNDTPDAYPTIEIMCVARILYSLGYISAEALKSTLFSHTAYTATHLLEAEELKPELLRSINNALAETHL